MGSMLNIFRKYFVFFLSENGEGSLDSGGVTDCCTDIHYNFPGDCLIHGGDLSDKPCSLTRRRMGKSVLVDRWFITACIFSVTKLCILFMRQELLQCIRTHSWLIGTPSICVHNWKEAGWHLLKKNGLYIYIYIV